MARANIFAQSDYYNVMQAMDNGKIIPTLVTTKEKDAHAALKRPIAGTFTMTSMLKYEPFMDDTITTFVRRLYKEFAIEDKACEIHKWIQYCMANTIYKFRDTFGLTFYKSLSM